MSPNKPKRLLNTIADRNFQKYFKINSNWEPFGQEDFYIAHTREYVDAVFQGIEPLASSNCLRWDLQLLKSVQNTNASLFESINHAIQNPDRICFSPTSGFHHAMPGMGSAFCTFSGQVIAAVKLYKKHKVRGAWIDLDGHYGNSISDSMDFVKDLFKILPEELQLNPKGKNEKYLENLASGLELVQNALLNHEIQYVVLCHGADSHEWDDLGHQCDTKHWLLASRMVYEMIKNTEKALDRNIPFAMTLFGGYRRDDYNSVLELHLASLMQSLEVLCERPDLKYIPNVKAPK